MRYLNVALRDSLDDIDISVFVANEVWILRPAGLHLQEGKVTAVSGIVVPHRLESWRT